MGREVPALLDGDERLVELVVTRLIKTLPKQGEGEMAGANFN